MFHFHMLEWKQILNFMICFMLFVFFEMLSQLFFFNSNDNILNLWKTNEQTKVFRTLKKKKKQRKVLSISIFHLKWKSENTYVSQAIEI